jgi:quercetin dioxygenase-like cupin family protein
MSATPSSTPRTTAAGSSGTSSTSQDLRRTEDVEIKWGVHARGEQRAEWQGDEYRTTVLLLVKGKFRITLSVDTRTLEREGDYAMWGPGIGHSWQAEEDSVVITVRWPSTPGR